MRVRYSQSVINTVHTRWGVRRDSDRRDAWDNHTNKTQVFTFNCIQVSSWRTKDLYIETQYTQEIYIIIQPDYMECSLIFSILLKFIIKLISQPTQSYITRSLKITVPKEQIKERSRSVQRVILMWVSDKGISWNEKKGKKKGS